MPLYITVVTLHILAAAAWIGSMIFFAAVVVPLLRRDELRAKVPSLIRLVGARYRILGWISLTTLLVTGVANFYLRFRSWELLANAAFWSQGFGRLFAWKLGLVAVVLILTLFHEVVVGRQAVDALERPTDAARAERIRRSASLLGRVTMLLSLVIVFLAVGMVRGCS